MQLYRTPVLFSEFPSQHRHKLNPEHLLADEFCSRSSKRWNFIRPVKQRFGNASWLTHYLSTQLNRTEAEPPVSERTIRVRDCMRGEIDMRVQLFKLTGVHLFSISGFGANTLLTRF